MIVPANAEYEIGFSFWLAKVWNIALNTGAKIVFYGSVHNLKIIRDIYAKHPIEAEFHAFTEWDDFLVLTREIKSNDNLIIVLSRQDGLSYHQGMQKYLCISAGISQRTTFCLFILFKIIPIS